MFKIGDTVFYGTSGICDIEDIATLDIQGIDKDRLYYALNMRNGSGKVYVAVDGDTSRMRRLLPKEEAQRLISRVSEIEPLELRDRKKPEKEYREALQKNDCLELFRLIKCIFMRTKQRSEEGRKPTAVDEKYMHLAEDMLYQELGVVLDIPKNQVLDYLMERIEGI